jgi:hypothetical protein
MKVSTGSIESLQALRSRIAEFSAQEHLSKESALLLVEELILKQKFILELAKLVPEDQARKINEQIYGCDCSRERQVPH